MAPGAGRAPRRADSPQDQPEGDGACGCRGGDPPATRGEEHGGALTESLQGPPGERRLLARELAAIVSTRWSAGSARSAKDSLRNRRAKQAATKASTTRPATAPASAPAWGLLAVMMMSRAITGRPNRAKTFQIPDTNV